MPNKQQNRFMVARSSKSHNAKVHVHVRCVVPKRMEQPRDVFSTIPKFKFRFDGAMFAGLRAFRMGTWSMPCVSVLRKSISETENGLWFQT